MSQIEDFEKILRSLDRKIALIGFAFVRKKEPFQPVSKVIGIGSLGNAEYWIFQFFLIHKLFNETIDLLRND
jgi:hypothetical protein